MIKEQEALAIRSSCGSCATHNKGNGRHTQSNKSRDELLWAWPGNRRQAGRHTPPLDSALWSRACADLQTSVHICRILLRSAQNCTTMCRSTQVCIYLCRSSLICADLRRSAQSCADLLSSAEIFVECRFQELGPNQHRCA